ncbi:hypothetical protein GONAM_11_01490 [Gordonia namibiensis NBRC 108229]|uniref:Uncharacterized protein n=2 Tax=Gordonia TaxID=2053 RepID=K6XMA4_9ACTN|nr:hypothetical protein GONAM_11_01490 [Gordonia namibiensis NBRC 108229]
MIFLARLPRASQGTHLEGRIIQFDELNAAALHDSEHREPSAARNDFAPPHVPVMVAGMGQHQPIEPDFNAMTDEDAAAAAHRRQIITYLGVIASLAALLVILLINM